MGGREAAPASGRPDVLPRADCGGGDSNGHALAPRCRPASTRDGTGDGCLGAPAWVRACESRGDRAQIRIRSIAKSRSPTTGRGGWQPACGGAEHRRFLTELLDVLTSHPRARVRSMVDITSESPAES